MRESISDDTWIRDVMHHVASNLQQANSSMDQEFFNWPWRYLLMHIISNALFTCKCYFFSMNVMEIQWSTLIYHDNICVYGKAYK